MFNTHLSSVPHNTHHLNRYIRFITTFIGDKKVKGVTEMHHICPKSIFPEFTNLKTHPWNKVHLQARAHFIAHRMLCKAFNDNRLQFAFWAMSHQSSNCQNRKYKINSKAYARAKQRVVEYLSATRSGGSLPESVKEQFKKSRNTVQSRLNNSYRQQRHDIRQKFSMDDEISAILDIASDCWNIPIIIARKLDIKEGFVKTVLKVHNINVTIDQSITKVYIKYGHKFKSYTEYVNNILLLHSRNLCVNQISSTLEVNECGVRSVLNSHKLKPNRGIPGPAKGSCSDAPSNSRGMHWYHNQTTGESGRFSTCPSGWTSGRPQITRSSKAKGLK
jgi:hypothetical protein